MFGTLLVALVVSADPPFQGKHEPLSEAVKKRVVGSSWKDGCPVPVEGLAYLTLTHWGFDGKVHEGELIVAKDVAAEVVAIFKELYEQKFLIEQMKLVDDYGADDDRSMEANNTTAFNCRPVYGRSAGFSRHSYGQAIDLNPKTNPYVTKKMVAPPGGKAFADRTKTYPGGIVDGDAITKAFASRGWEWGGAWKSYKDYQHFEKKKPGK